MVELESQLLASYKFYKRPDLLRLPHCWPLMQIVAGRPDRITSNVAKDGASVGVPQVFTVGCSHQRVEPQDLEVLFNLFLITITFRI